MKIYSLEASDFSEAFLFQQSDFGSEILESVVSLDSTYFPYPWTHNVWKQTFAEDNYSLFCIYDEELLGFTLYKLSPWDKSAHLLKIIVSSRIRELGVGKKMLQSTIAKLGVQEVHLEVSSDNKVAIELYKSCQFQEVRRQESFYSDGKTAIFFLLGAQRR